MNIRISRASEHNGDAFRKVNRTRNVKKLKNCIAAKAAQQAAMLPSYVCCADYAIAFYIAAEAA